MARSRSIIGFETGALASEGSQADDNTSQHEAVGNAAIDSSVVRTGTYSLKVNPNSGAAGYWRPRAAVISFGVRYFRCYVRVTVRPSVLARTLFGDATTLSGVINILLNTDGTLQLRQGITNIGSASATALTDTARWYRIEIDVVSGSTATLYIDGVNENSGSTSATGNICIFGAKGDTIADTYTAYYDDIVWDDAVLPGVGQAVLLVPTGDNARDTLWTGGTGGTTNLWDAVDNRPPVGTASETNTTQIEHAGGASGTTDRYDANMTTYSAAGITAADTINAVQGVIVTGEDSGTGDKLLNTQILSNPVGTATSNFNVADNVSSALGTFPSGWFTNRTPITNTPSVTVTTAPVMRVVRPETASRVASVCFMGIYVDYTPYVAFPPLFSREPHVVRI